MFKPENVLLGGAAAFGLWVYFLLPSNPSAADFAQAQTALQASLDGLTQAPALSACVEDRAGPALRAGGLRSLQPRFGGWETVDLKPIPLPRTVLAARWAGGWGDGRDLTTLHAAVAALRVWPKEAPRYAYPFALTTAPTVRVSVPRALLAEVPLAQACGALVAHAQGLLPSRPFANPMTPSPPRTERFARRPGRAAPACSVVGCDEGFSFPRGRLRLETCSPRAWAC